MERIPIPRKLRFEVLKRDKFKCQYCGRGVPDVVLHVDHIIPVAEGGTNDIFNLTTSCSECNLGKGKIKLDDETQLEKQSKRVKEERQNLEELQDRKEQVEMYYEWQNELLDFENIEVNFFSSLYNKLTTYYLTETGRQNAKQIIKKFGYELAVEALKIACDRYLEYDENGSITNESAERVCKYIGGICFNKQKEKSDPELSQLLYIAGIMANRFGWKTKQQYYYEVKHYRDNGCDLDKIKECALCARYITEFRNMLDN